MRPAPTGPRREPVATGEAAGARRRSPPPLQPPGEVGGPEGPEPTRYGDWEKGGRCTDF